MYTPTNSNRSSFSYGRRSAIALNNYQFYRRMKVYYLMDYLPSRYSATSEQARDRRAIYDFKDGNCPARIINGLADGIRRIADGNTVVCFVPASTQYKTLQRYGTLSSRLEALTGKRCSYTAITKPEDGESGHIGGKSSDPAAEFQFNSTFFTGKKVILIDDVMTRGRTLEGTAQRLREHGATDVVGLVAGLTINPDWSGGEDRNVERL